MTGGPTFQPTTMDPTTALWLELFTTFFPHLRADREGFQLKVDMLTPSSKVQFTKCYGCRLAAQPLTRTILFVGNTKRRRAKASDLYFQVQEVQQRNFSQNILTLHQKLPCSSKCSVGSDKLDLYNINRALLSYPKLTPN
jgi:hypothetical protein